MTAARQKGKVMYRDQQVSVFFFQTCLWKYRKNGDNVTSWNSNSGVYALTLDLSFQQRWGSFTRVTETCSTRRRRWGYSFNACVCRKSDNQRPAVCMITISVKHIYSLQGAIKSQGIVFKCRLVCVQWIWFGTGRHMIIWLIITRIGRSRRFFPAPF